MFESYLVRLLAIMRRPLAFGQFHMGENCLERGIFRRAGVDAETDLSAALPHMADTHLWKMLAVSGTLDAVVIFTAAEAVPHGLDIYHTIMIAQNLRFDISNTIYHKFG